jgi:predicted metal-dependent enzyme (double-stranded beta helix superfamily)
MLTHHPGCSTVAGLSRISPAFAGSAMVAPLRSFVVSVTEALDHSAAEEDVVPVVRGAMKDLVASPDWLPEEFRLCSADSYSQHLLYCDPRERFSVVSFVWEPGQLTPVHDHTVWGVIGQLIGEEQSQSFQVGVDGALVEVGAPEVLSAGQITTLSPNDIDIHMVRNATDEVAVSIHAYGANIGRIKRHSYNRKTGRKSVFISSYANSVIPNIWR